MRQLAVCTWKTITLVLFAHKKGRRMTREFGRCILTWQQLLSTWCLALSAPCQTGAMRGYCSAGGSVPPVLLLGMDVADHNGRYIGKRKLGRQNCIPDAALLLTWSSMVYGVRGHAWIFGLFQVFETWREERLVSARSQHWQIPVKSWESRTACISLYMTKICKTGTRGRAVCESGQRVQSPRPQVHQQMLSLTAKNQDLRGTEEL